MRTDIVVVAEPRSTRGKNSANRTRMAGQIPAVVYGAYKDPIAVSVSPKEISRILRSKTGYNTIFNLTVGADTTPVMVVDEQFDPLRGNLLHADFKRIDLNKRITVTVPVHVTGEPKGVKIQGGLLEIVNRSVQIECLPDEIPAEFVFDVTELMLNESRRGSDVPLTGSMKLVSPADSVLAHVVALRATAETTADAAAPGATAEPEVIKKGKKEEEGAADKDKKKK